MQIKKIMSMVCDNCRLVMPIDHEKSNEKWRVFKNECSCGSSKSTPIFHPEDEAPTKEALEHFIKMTAKPITPPKGL